MLILLRKFLQKTLKLKYPQQSQDKSLQMKFVKPCQQSQEDKMYTIDSYR